MDLGKTCGFGYIWVVDLGKTCGFGWIWVDLGRFG